MMLNYSISVAFLVALACGILKASSVTGQEHCNGPITIGEVTAVRVSPDLQAARVVQLTMTSTYKLKLTYPSYNGVPVPLQDDGSGINARESRRGDEFHFSVHSTTPMNSSLLSLVISVDHPCNKIKLVGGMDFFRAVYEQGISLPKVSTMPKNGYRLDKDKSFSLRFGMTYKDDGKRELMWNGRSSFYPMYVWDDSNIMKTLEEIVRGPERGGILEPRKAEQRRWNTTSGGYTTSISEFEVELGESFPIDGALVLFRPVSVYVKEANRLGPSADIYMFLSIHLTDDPYGLPVYVGSWRNGPESQKYTYKLDVQKGGKYNVVTLGLNPNVPKDDRIVRFLSAGAESSPILAVARVLSGNPTNSEITDVKLADLIKTYQAGSIASTAFKVDMPLGSEAFYICSASNGSDVTNTIVKMVHKAPAQAVVRVSYERSNRTMANCTVTGYPSPTMRLFLLPNEERDVSDPEEFLKNSLKYELTESTDLVTVTTISTNPLKKSVSFDWAPMRQKYSTPTSYGLGLYFKCLATNKYAQDLNTGYLYN